MVWEDLTPREILTTEAFENAVDGRRWRSGGSTNAIIHLIAMARPGGRVASTSTASTRSRAARRFLANIRPSGAYLMEDFYLRGRPAAPFSRACADLLALDALTVNGRTLGENVTGAGRLQRRRDRAARAARSAPKAASRCCAATSRPTARSSSTRRPSRGCSRTRARRSSSATTATSTARIDDPALPVTADSVLVLQNAGPLGAPGMPEWGMLPIPKKLLQQGVRDMVRDLGRAHERHGLRRLRAPRGAGIVRRAGRSRSCATATSSSWTSRSGGSRCTSPNEELADRRRRPGRRGRPCYPRGFGLLFMRHVTQAARGLRLRLPAPRRGDAGAGDPLNRTSGEHRPTCATRRGRRGRSKHRVRAWNHAPATWPPEWS